MIAYLQGTLTESSPTQVIVDCHGVGYGVFIPVSSYEKLPAKGSPVKLLTYHHVVANEGTHQLYGFMSREEREMFLLLISVSGIGPRLAINILSTASIPSLRQAIVSADTKTLSTFRGIGKKTAERLVVELRDKLGKHGPIALPGTTAAPGDARVADTVSALVALGFKPAEADRVAQNAATKLGATATVEELVRAALRGS